MPRLILVHIDSNNKSNALYKASQELVINLVSYGFKVKVSYSLDKEEVNDAHLVLSLHSHGSKEVLIIKDDKSYSKSGRVAYTVYQHLTEHYNCTISSNKEIGRLFTYIFNRTNKVPTIIILYNSHRQDDNTIFANLLAQAINNIDRTH